MKKFNVLDIIIAVVILVCLVGAGMRFLGSSSKLREKSGTFDYVLKVKSLRECSVEAIEKAAKENAQITDTLKKNVVGNVYDFKAVPARDIIEMADGSLKDAEIPERFDAYVYIRATGEITDQSYVTKSGTEILIDRESYYTTCWSGFYGEVWDVGRDLSKVKY